MDNRWNWDQVNEGDKCSFQSPVAAPSLSTKCLFALSPNGQLAVFARDKTLMIFATHDDKMDLVNARTITGPTFSPKDYITAISCVPILSQQISNEGAIDWTAIVIGMASGTLRVFNESGVPLFSQSLLLDQPIKSIKCSSFYSDSLSGRSSSSNSADKIDEVLVFFQKSVILIEGFIFYQTIRSARNHVAKTRPGSSAELNVTLSYTIYNLRSNSAKYQDCFSCGLSTCSLLDHLIFASYDGSEGPSVTGKSKSLFTSLVTIGEEPFVGLYHASDSSNGSLIDTVASAVMNKAMTFIPFASSGPPPPTNINVAERLGIYDQPRGALSGALSPDRKFIAIADSLARVMIIDIEAMLVLRIWKGYRNAQCAWLSVSEDASNHQSKRSLCLVIYAPKRGLLEVWKVVNGPRIAVFSVSKDAQMVNFTHSIFGLNSVSICKFPHYMNYRPYFFDFASGNLFSLDVPFVCTLTDPNSRVVRDSHFIRELADIFQNEPLNEVKLNQVLLKIETFEAKNKAIEMSLDRMDTVKQVSSVFLNDMKKKIEASPDALKYEDKLLFQTCLRIEQLLQLYLKLQVIEECECETLDFHQQQELPEIDSFALELSWSASDVAKCLSLFTLRHSIIPPSSTPPARCEPSFKEFISIFQVNQQQVVKSPEGELITSSIEVAIDWSNAKQAEAVKSVGSFIFQPLMNQSANPLDIIQWLSKSSVCRKHLLRLIFQSWLNDTHYFDHWKNWQRFSLIISSITDQCGDEWNDDKSNTILPITWQIICSKIISSTNLPASLIGVVVAKTIAEERTQVLKKPSVAKDTGDLSKDPFDADAEWEALHLDKEKLNLLFKQIEDVFLLELLLKSDRGRVSESPSLSLEFLIKSDAGIISELIAKWLVQLNLDPMTLLTNATEVGEELTEESAGEGESHRSIDLDSTRELLGHVRTCFPYSLDPQVIIANCCWECICIWDKSPCVDNYEYLKKAVTFLSQVTSPTLVHNLSCLIWKTFIVRKFETLAQLSEKMAKIPKDRICRKELNMGDECIECLLSFSCDILENILDNAKRAETESSPAFPMDEWWKNCSNETSASTRTPLITYATSSVKSSNSLIVLAHWHLAQVLLLMASFTMKSVKPLSLFMPATRKIFFKDLSHTKNDDVFISDLDLIQARTEFLYKSCTVIAQTIPPKSECVNEGNLLISPTKIHSDANKWLGKLLLLAREWELNVDAIRRRFVCELYANDCDAFADEILSSVSDKALFATEVLPIVCNRVKFLVNANEIAFSLHPTVQHWIQSIECQFKVHPASKETTVKLLQLTMAILPDSSPSQKLLILLWENFSCLS